MKKPPAFDYVRMEKEPPRVPEPWSILRGGKGNFYLFRENILMKECFAQSENGAHREGLLFIKTIEDL